MALAFKRNRELHSKDQIETTEGIDSFAITLNKKIKQRHQIPKETCDAQGKYLQEHIVDIEEKVKVLKKTADEIHINHAEFLVSNMKSRKMLMT